ncbi:MAG TPA: penicillin-binding protein 2 [Candidatus Dormibacteraeota bacterium]|nr:penicillin-binding protein 2 [Candidatus Dormibacteraeota bacterium]
MFGVHEVSPSVRRRVSLAATLAVVVVLLLGARLWSLQVLRGEEMAVLSENNRIRLRRDPAARGRVVDRNGAVVIDSQASFDAVLVPEDARDLPSVVETLAPFLGQSSAETQAVLDRAAGRPAFQEVTIKRNLTYDEVAAIETHQVELAGVSLRVTPARVYPNGPTLAHVLGYVGEVTQGEVERNPGFRPGDVVGKAGLEKTWESDLRGIEGGQQIEVDALGRELRVLDEAEAVPGHTLVLSVDLALQQAAEQALGENAGAVVALDPRNGDVLAMVSEPSFDPNAFTGGIKPELWRELTTHPRHPLNARATQGQYPPGSTFKIIVATAALEEGIVNPFTRLTCPGYLNFGNHTFRCWRKGGHGSVNVHDALVGSCDVFFYQAGARLGIDTLARYAREFGLGAPTGIEIGNERSGLMPDSAWKKKRFQQPWQKGETLSVAIGQGAVTATPLQMAEAVATIATGVRYQPRLVQRVEAIDGSLVREIPPRMAAKLEVRDTVLKQVQEALVDVVDHGTGKNAKLPNIMVGGKTGTSQVVTIGSTRLKAAQMKWNQRDHAWFVAFAPAEEPTIAIATLVEHADGGGGAIAAPIAKEVLKAYFRLQEERGGVRVAQN